MKIKIDQNGCLELERGGKMKSQFCPYSYEIGFEPGQPCGHWCPHFGEPVHDILIGELSGKEIVDGGWTIEICQGRVLTGEIVDEREVKK